MHLLGRNLNIPIQRALSRRKCCLELVKMAVWLSLNVLGQASLGCIHISLEYVPNHGCHWLVESKNKVELSSNLEKKGACRVSCMDERS
ncbi:hypothetical protein Peur_015121 [Populus x canadensis]